MSFFNKTPKRNIYTIDLNIIIPFVVSASDFVKRYATRKDTPLPLKSINGDEIYNNTRPIYSGSGLYRCARFPTPFAIRMVEKEIHFIRVFGTEISKQIIEYLDKATGEPVVQVYPDSVHIFDGYEENYMSHLNHATRRDLEKQIALRERLINEFIAKQNQNQKG